MRDKRRAGIDFVNFFAPVARMALFWLVVALAGELGLQLHPFDANKAFLDVEISQYMSKIEGFGRTRSATSSFFGARSMDCGWPFTIGTTGRITTAPGLRHGET